MNHFKIIFIYQQEEQQFDICIYVIITSNFELLHSYSRLLIQFLSKRRVLISSLILFEKVTNRRRFLLSNCWSRCAELFHRGYHILVSKWVLILRNSKQSLATTCHRFLNNFIFKFRFFLKECCNISWLNCSLELICLDYFLFLVTLLFFSIRKKICAIPRIIWKKRRILLQIITFFKKIFNWFILRIWLCKCSYIVFRLLSRLLQSCLKRKNKRSGLLHHWRGNIKPKWIVYVLILFLLFFSRKQS